MIIRASLLVLALGLTGLSSVRTLESYQLLSGQSAVERLYDGHQLTPQEVDKLISSRKAALRWFDRAQSYKDIGMAKFRSAQHDAQPRPAAETEQKRPALHYLDLGLRHAPVDARAWFVIALEQAEADNIEPSISALEQSLHYGANVASLAAPRASFGLQYWPQLTTALKSKLRSQIDLAFQTNSPDLLPAIGNANVPSGWKYDLSADVPAFQRLLQALD